MGAEFEYTMTGKGDWLNELQGMILRLQLSGCVKLSGFKPQEEIKSCLDADDVFLLPSLTAKGGDMEGIPVALMDAMAVGLPVVSSQHSGIPELIENTISGWLAAEGDDKSLANILFSLAQEENDIETVIKVACDKVETEFSQYIAYRERIRVLEQIVQTPSG
ncbi:colanic acid/amylovoran biosynthesis glycosyltransferase [Izhakiella capsodis]|uniref:Colanic acid/amylovoran biosynthesis glycosyltransferase n=1 Tax=Izhakiella capsodis TaxID=1367852 RepID=A0A1I4Y547_9GAMM|nr:colanic acid/amylovoran biosynthesis glycosyltransferase [Izhakiella capsodis]